MSLIFYMKHWSITTFDFKDFNKFQEFWNHEFDKFSWESSTSKIDWSLFKNVELITWRSEYFASILTSDSILELAIITFDFINFRKEFWDSPSSKLRVKFRYEFVKLQKLGVNDLTFN